MPRDKVETLGRSLVQHGPLSGRVYLMKLHPDDAPSIVDAIDKLAHREGYTKIFAKVPSAEAHRFEEAGYHVEATVPGFFNGHEDGVFLARYFDPDRSDPADPELLQDVLDTALAKEPIEPPRPPEGFDVRELSSRHSPAMAELYARIFNAYPFPIHDPKYLADTMDSHVRYFGLFQNDRLVAQASAERDIEAQNAELTDFATLPEHRGLGLAGALLGLMETECAKEDIKTAYSIARAQSHGVNIVFAKHGYNYAGTLINNTHISTGLESMNVWHKPLS